MSDQTQETTSSTITTPRVEKRFRSLGLPDGFKFNYYQSLDDVLTDLGGDSSKVLAIVNSNLSAHSTATEARDQFTDDLEKITGFAFLTKEVTGTGKNVSKTRTVADESEAEYVGRLRKHLLEGLHFKHASDLVDVLRSFTTPPEKDQKAIEAWLQSVADARTYDLDARVTERTGKEKGLPQYATNGAKAIYAGNADAGRSSEDNWVFWQKRFKKESGTVLNERTGVEADDLKALAVAIVTNEKAQAENKYK